MTTIYSTDDTTHTDTYLGTGLTKNGSWSARLSTTRRLAITVKTCHDRHTHVQRHQCYTELFFFRTLLLGEEYLGFLADRSMP